MNDLTAIAPFLSQETLNAFKNLSFIYYGKDIGKMISDSLKSTGQDDQ